MKKTVTALAAALITTGVAWAETMPNDVVFVDGAVEESLTGVAGDPVAGRAVMNKGKGNCVACHQTTDLTEYSFQGEIGPSLDGVADRWTEAELRGIITNAKMMFEGTMMPAMYKTQGFLRPGDKYTGKAGTEPLPSLLNAQQIEDAVAYLMTLTE